MTTAEDPSGKPADLPVTGDGPSPAEAATWGNGSSLAQLLKLSVQHPSDGVCVVTVDGELDMLTAPLLDACARDQFATAPAHLILDLQPVRFFGSTGLTCLLQARELAQQIHGTQLHLAGLANRAVARPLTIAALLDLFDTYPTLPDALAALAGSSAAPPSAMKRPSAD